MAEFNRRGELMAEEDVYIIVCTQLHQAIGPYHDAGEALKVAEQLTKEDQCVYVPVPMHFRGQLVIMEKGEGGKGNDYQRPGQYL